MYEDGAAEKMAEMIEALRRNIDHAIVVHDKDNNYYVQLSGRMTEDQIRRVAVILAETPGWCRL